VSGGVYVVVGGRTSHTAVVHVVIVQQLGFESLFERQKIDREAIYLNGNTILKIV